MLARELTQATLPEPRQPGNLLCTCAWRMGGYHHVSLRTSELVKYILSMNNIHKSGTESAHRGER
jgi:hypothetical protein